MIVSNSSRAFVFLQSTGPQPVLPNFINIGPSVSSVWTTTDHSRYPCTAFRSGYPYLSTHEFTAKARLQAPLPIATVSTDELKLMPVSVIHFLLPNLSNLPNFSRHVRFCVVCQISWKGCDARYRTIAYSY